jgi:hypothetical protein
MTVLLGLVISQLQPLPAEIKTPEALISAWTRRYRLRDDIALLCRTVKMSGNEAPHGGAWVMTKSNPIAEAALSRPGKRVFPVGSMLIKEKFDRQSGGKPTLFTGMVKREKGFAPKVGDWEFFVVNLAKKRFVERGKMESCVGCHQTVANEGYVFSIASKSRPQVHLR